MNLITIFGKMLVILFGVAAGFAANRLGYFTKETDRSLGKLIMNITMPAMILATVMTGDELPATEVILSGMGVAAVFYGLGIAFMLVMPRFLGGTAGEKGVWGFSFLFPNLAFIGYPVITALLGKEALLAEKAASLQKKQGEYEILASQLGVLTAEEIDNSVIELQEFLDKANGGDNISALAIKVGLDQERAYYVSPAFNGSSVARDEVGDLMQKCFTAKTDNVDGMIKKAFADAVSECEYQAG